MYCTRGANAPNPPYKYSMGALYVIQEVQMPRLLNETLQIAIHGAGTNVHVQHTLQV